MADDPLGMGKSLEAIAEITKEGRELLSSLAGPSAAEIGQLLADKIRMRRLRNLNVMLQEAKQILNEAGVEPKPVILKNLFPILEHSSLEEDTVLIKKWAGLLASAANGDPVESSYPKILDELSPVEVRILDLLFDGRVEMNPVIQGYYTEEIKKKIDLPEKRLPILVENLSRLRLCDSRGDLIVGGGPENPVRSFFLGITPLGLDFVRACRGPTPQ